MTQPNAKNGKLRVLNLEDSPNDSELILAELETAWSEVELLRVEMREAFVRALDEFAPDIVLSDFNLPDMSGREALHIVRQTHPDIPVVMVTGALGDIEAVELVKQGARDYVMKDHLQRLASAVQGALSLEQGIRARKAAEESLRQSEEEIRELVERSPVAMIVDAGVDEKVIMMNRRFTELFGYTLEDVPDLHRWWLLAYPDEQYREEIKTEWIRRVGKAIQEHGDIEPMEARVTCKDGSIRYVRVSFASIGSRHIITFEDLTRRKKLEDALKEAADRNRTITETANDAIICIDPAGKVYLWNRKAEEIFGYAAAEAVGRNLHELITPQRYREQAGQAMRHFAQTGSGPIVGTTRQLDARRKDGSEFPIELSVSAMNIHGEWHATGIIRDITERKQDEARIAQLNRLYEALSQCNQAIVRSTSEQELFTQICQSVVQFGGFKMAWIGLLDPATQVVKPMASCGGGAEAYLRGIGLSVDADSEQGQGPVGSAIREDRPFWCQDCLNASYTAVWHDHAAASGWRSSAALPLHREGAVVGAFNLYSDIVNAFDQDVCGLLTEMAADISYALDYFSQEARRRLAEGELRKLSLAVEQSPSSIVITDLDARLEYVNDAFVRTTGYSREEAIGQNPRILHSGRTPQATYDDMWAHLTRGEIWKGELVNKRKDGGEYIESILLSPVRDSGGRTTHYIGIKEDITERKRVEAQVIAQLEHVTSVNAQLLEANSQLEQARNQLLQSEKMAAIGLLAAGVAHEINNPVGYVNSNLGSLEKYLADIFVVVDKYEAAEALQGKGNQQLEELRQFKAKIDFNYLREDIRSLIAESHQGLERIKKIILDLKDFSRSEVNEQWGWADVHHGLDTTLNVVWNELKYKCEVVKEYGDLPDIYCLPSQLNQVFMNLLVNAAQAIEVRGTITIRTGQDGERVWVEVSDTGKGIPPENIQRLFDPFFTTKPVGLGTGLGLSVSYNIVEKHHGKIEVHSEVGKGTTFRVWLPVK